MKDQRYRKLRRKLTLWSYSDANTGDEMKMKEAKSAATTEQAEGRIGIAGWEIGCNGDFSDVVSGSDSFSLYFAAAASCILIYFEITQSTVIKY